MRRPLTHDAHAAQAHPRGAVGADGSGRVRLWLHLRLRTVRGDAIPLRRQGAALLSTVRVRVRVRARARARVRVRVRVGVS